MWSGLIPKTRTHHSRIVAPYDNLDYRSKTDVRGKSEIYRTLKRELEDGNHIDTIDVTIAVAKVRGKDRPDVDDVAAVERMTITDAANNMLLSTFVEEKYWPHVTGKCRAKVVKEYRGMWQRYNIADRVTGIRVRDFSTKDGRDLLQQIASEFDISKSTLQRVKFLLSGIFTVAKNEGLLRHEDGFELPNPMEGVMLPNARGPKDTYAYSLDQILQMLSLFEDDTVKAVIGVAAFAGLREGEIIGLCWNDWSGDALKVQRSVTRVKGGWEVNDPKSSKSAASVPCIPRLKMLLENHKNIKIVHVTPVGEVPFDGRAFHGCLVQDNADDRNLNYDDPKYVKALGGTHELMFSGIEQEWMDLDKLAQRVIRPVVEAAGIKWHGWHALRRGIASNLYALGASDKVVQRILRHSKPQVTKERYIQAFDADVIEGMGKLEQAINQKMVHCA